MTSEGKPSDEHVPMTRPDEAIAIHKQNYGHSSTFAVLEGGRLLHAGAGTFSISEDGGVTWDEPFVGRDASGESVSGISLTRLGDGGLGLVAMQRDPGGSRKADAVFRRSDDEGRTWSEPVRMNRHWPGYCLQDTLVCTQSGRLVAPMYASFGQGSPHVHGAPFVGGYLNGRFVSCDAHFRDPHFMFSYVLYSDDHGRTWQQCDGELHIQMAPGGAFEYAGEPTVAEVEPGRLIMLVRTRLGRLFQAFSNDNGKHWTRLQPTTLAAATTPAQIRRIPANGHLLVVWNQENDQTIRKGLHRLRISTAISRNGGGVWEFFQNVESLWPETRIEPGPIRPTLPESVFFDAGVPAGERPEDCPTDLPEGFGTWSYPSALVAEDRVLIAHTYMRYDRTARPAERGSKLKVLPLSWFYDGEDPLAEDVRRHPHLDKIARMAQP